MTRLGRNVLFLVLDSGIISVVQIVITMIVLRTWGEEVWGMVSFLMVIAALAIMLGDLGGGQATNLLIGRRRAGLHHEDAGPVAAAGLLQSLIGAALVTVAVLVLPRVLGGFIDWIDRTDLAAQFSQVRGLMPLIAVWVFAAVLMQQTVGIFAGFQATQYTFIQNLAIHPLRLVFCIVVVVAAWSWRAIIVGWTGCYVVGLVVAFILVRRVLYRHDQKLSLVGFRPARRLRLGLALFTPMAAAFIVNYTAVGVMWWFDPMGDGFRAIGRFAPLWIIGRGYEVLLLPMATAMLPAVSDAHGSRDPAVLEHLVRRTLTATGLVSAAILLVIVLVPGLLTGLFGVGGIEVALVVLAFGGAIEAQRCTLDPILNGSGHARWVTAIEWTKFALVAVLGIPLFRQHYLTGMAVALAAAFIPATVVKLVIIRWKLRIRILRRSTLVGVLLVVVFALGMALAWWQGKIVF